MTTDQNSWHLRKELSIGTIVSLVILGVGSIGAYYTAMAQIEKNAESVEELSDVPAKVIRIEEQLLQLREQQVELKRDLANSSAESRESDSMTLEALNQILIQMAKLEQKLEQLDD